MSEAHHDQSIRRNTRRGVQSWHHADHLEWTACRYHEGEEAITSRITAPGAIALGAFSKHGDLVAYAIGHPCAGDPPPLSRPVCPSRIPDAGSAPYALLHDLCVLPEWRGGGLGRALAYAWMSAAAGKGAFEAVRLVAVARRDAFWRRLGFEPVEDLAVQRTVAESYGDNAVVMERPFA